MFLGILTALKVKPISHKPIDGINPEAEANHQQTNGIRSLLSPAELPPSNPGTQTTCTCHHHKTPWWKIALEIGTFLAALGAFISAAVYAAITNKQLHAMNQTFGEVQKQTILMRQQLVGTQGAIIRVSTDWEWPRRKLTIQAVNDGQVTGSIKSIEVTITRSSLPRMIPIGQPLKMHDPEREIAAKGAYADSIVLPWDMPNNIDVNIWPGKEVTIAEGQFTYDNGFGDLFTNKFCFFYLPPWVLQGSGQGWGGGGWNGGTECRIDSALAGFNNIKKRIAEEKKSAHQ